MGTAPSARPRFDNNSLIAVFAGMWAAVFGLAPDRGARLLVIAPALLGVLVWWAILSPERWLALFFVCSLLLPPLPFPIGNSGIHVAVLAAFIGVLAGALRASQWRSCRGSLPLGFVLFLAVLTESVAFAIVYSGWQIALGSLARVLLFGISIYVFLYTYAGPRGNESNPLSFARLLYWIGLLGATFACVDFYFQLPPVAGYGAQFVWLEHSVIRRAQGVFYEASTLGNFCAFFLVMILVSSFSTKHQSVYSRIVLLPGALVFSAALIFSSSRASAVTVVVAICAFAFLRRSNVIRVITAVSISLAAASAAVRFALPAFSTNYWSRIAVSMQNLGSSPNGVLSGRITYWKALAEFLVQHPWHVLFGIGYKTIPYTDFAGVNVVADNTYLSLLVETGVVGLAAFVFLNTAVLRTAYRAARSDDKNKSFFGTWIFCFWCGELVQMLSGDLITYWRVLPLYFWVLAIAAREVGD
jgi:O-antigen ligase